MWAFRTTVPNLTFSFILLASARSQIRARKLQHHLLYSSLLTLSSLSGKSSVGSYYHMSAADMGSNSSKGDGPPVFKAGQVPAPKVTFTEEELKSKLTAQEFDVTQNKGTERAWTGKYANMKDDGTFTCVVCGVNLFKSDKKFESGSGWPSFTDVAENGNVHRVVDESYGMKRVEVVCANCGAHLGHVFEDGPKEDTGLRYCINSCSLNFKKKEGGN